MLTIPTYPREVPAAALAPAVAAAAAAPVAAAHQQPRPLHNTSATLSSDTGIHNASTLTICHVNINSITSPGRLDELQQFTDTNNIDILTLSETKLDDNVHPSLFHIQNFQTPFTRHRNRRGGGTAIYTRTNIPTRRLPELETKDEEWIWTKTQIRSNTILTCTIYLPPNQTYERQTDFLDRLANSLALAQTYRPTSIIMLGDFNTGNIYLEGHTNHSGITSFDIRLKDMLDTSNFSQIIHAPTRHNDNTQNLRDLIIINNTYTIHDSGILSPFSNIDHFPVYITLNIETPARSSATKTRQIWDYKNTDIPLLTHSLLQIDWDEIMNLDVHKATEEFTATVLTAASQAIPTKTVRIRQKDKPWMTTELRRQIRKRDRLFRLARKTQTPESWEAWRRQRNLTTDHNTRLRNAHMETQARRILENKQNPYKYHRILRQAMGRQQDQTIPPLETTDGTIVGDDRDKANILNDYFAAQTQLNVQNNIPTPSPIVQQIPDLHLMQVTESEVLRTLNSIDVNKSSGSDALPAKLIRMIALLIVTPLTQLFNKSLALGIFPNSWKEANVTPIFKKKGSASDPQNYRPISLLPTLSKVLERLVFNQIYAHMTSNHLLSDRQSGYRPRHSTQLQLITLTHNLYKSLDHEQDITHIYLDISKFFDKIWHKGLLFKCKHDFHISGSLLQWLTTYLSNRRQKVRIGDTFSMTKKLEAGCPQGSVLGPLLALMYLDGLASKVTNDVMFYADDTSLYMTHNKDNIDTAQRSLQHDLDAICDYGRNWAITFNASKTIQQTFTRRPNSPIPALKFGGESIVVKTSHKHLGVIFSNDLHFHEHINDVVRKINVALSPLYPIARYIPRSELIQIYVTYIRPYFDYCDILYDGHITKDDELRLERLQTRAARLVTGTPYRTPTDKLRRELGWDSLKTRRKIHKLIFYRKLLDTRHSLPDYLTPILTQTRGTATQRRLRNTDTMTLPPNRTMSFQRSFIPDTTRLWNRLPQSIRASPSLATFKTALIKHIGCHSIPNLLLYRHQKRQQTSHTTQNRNTSIKRLSFPNTKIYNSALSMWISTRRHQTFRTILSTL